MCRNVISIQFDRIKWENAENFIFIQQSLLTLAVEDQFLPQIKRDVSIF